MSRVNGESAVSQSKEEMPRDERIVEMIKTVDSRCKKKRFTRSGLILFIFGIAVMLIMFSLMIYILIRLYEIVLLFATAIPEEEKMGYLATNAVALVALSIAMVQGILAFPALKKSSVRDLTNEYYKELSTDYGENDRPYLKALIRMKCSEFDVRLLRLYENKKTRSLFEDSELIEQLYEPY